jgi:hypothetical protein
VIAYYVILAAVTAVVIPIDIVAGSGKHAQPGIADGYMVSAGTACLGPTAQVMRSGSFVTISNTQSTLSGNLTLKNKHLTGTVTCVNHSKEAIDATPGTFRLTGTIGGQPLHAELVAQPPPAGTPTPLVPGSVSGVYAIAPSSTCLGTKMTLSGPSSRVKVVTGMPRGVLTSHKGMLAGAAPARTLARRPKAVVLASRRAAATSAR